MVAAGLNTIRVGESVWSTWEPREGEFDLDWLAPVLEAAHERGISAIVGTPTYAAPPWLRRKYPETTARTATGVEQPYGARQDIDCSHPAFRFLAERLIRKVVERYAGHPAVLGWQVDNEPGLKLFYNHSVFQGFLEYLRDRYGDVDALNKRWGLTYWSHRLSDWADLWPPDGNTTPSYDLAWRRYQAQLTHDFISWQAGIVRSLVPESHFVTTCVALGQVGLDISRVGEPLDVVGTNVYYGTQDDLELPGPDEPSGGLYPFFVAWGGPAWLYLQADLSRGTRQQPFLVTETNATSIGGSADKLPVVPGPTPAGGVEPGRPRRPAGGVLALAFLALRRGDLLGRHHRPQPAARTDLRRTRRCRSRTPEHRRRHRRTEHPQRCRRPCFGRESLGDGVHGPLERSGRRLVRRQELLREDSRRLLPGVVGCRVVRRRAGPRPAAGRR